MPALVMAGALTFGGGVSPAAAAEDLSPRIVVSGEGEASAVPDMALITVGVVRDGKTAAEALAANSSAMQAVLDSLRADGIADRDLQTTSFSINPQYQYPTDPNGQGLPPVLTGYQANNMLTIRLRDLARIGTLLDKVVTLGVNQGGDIRFLNEKMDPIRAKARSAAVKDAMEKARQLAEAAGVTLGPVLEISENSMASPPIPMVAMAMEKAAAAPVPVAAGENAYHVSVSVTFGIGGSTTP